MQLPVISLTVNSKNEDAGMLAYDRLVAVAREMAANGVDVTVGIHRYDPETDDFQLGVPRKISDDTEEYQP